jgi:hypothetical protein
MLACTWQALEDLVIRMGQKKGLNLLIVTPQFAPSVATIDSPMPASNALCSA